MIVVIKVGDFWGRGVVACASSGGIAARYL